MQLPSVSNLVFCCFIFLHSICHYLQFFFYSMHLGSLHHASPPSFRAAVFGCRYSSLEVRKLSKSSYEHTTLQSCSSGHNRAWGWGQCLQVQCCWANMCLTTNLVLDKNIFWWTTCFSLTQFFKNWKIFWKYIKYLK